MTFPRQNVQRSTGKSTPPQGLDTDAITGASVKGYAYAITMWKREAGFKRLVVNGQTATGGAGCLRGPGLASFMKQAPESSRLHGDDRKVFDAVAGGVSEQFKAWQDWVTVPGLPWYPAFMACNGRKAGPRPNVETRLGGCASARVTEMRSDSLKAKILARLDGGIRKKYRVTGQLVEVIARAIAARFAHWLANQPVANVMGEGPVPTYSPPFVPAGPVVRGRTLPGKHFP
jgi:hypothetical protein